MAIRIFDVNIYYVNIVAAQSLDVLSAVLNERNVNTVKVAVQCFATVYPLLFRQLYVRPAISTQNN